MPGVPVRNHTGYSIEKVPGKAPHDLAVDANLRWIAESLPLFVGYVSQSAKRSRVKPIGELSMVYAYTHRWWGQVAQPPTSAPWAEFPGHLEEWRRLLASFCASGVLASLVQEDPENCLYFLQPYLWLRTTGHRDDRCEELIRNAWQDGQRPTSAGMLHVLHVAGLTHTAPDWGGVCRSSFLTKRLSGDELDRDAYRLTHAIFYATELGSAESGLEPGERRALDDLVRTVAGRARRAGRWDLLVEALLSLICLGSDEDTDGRNQESIQLLMEVRRTDGGLPKDSGVGQRLLDAELTDSPTRSPRFVGWDSFKGCYHATLADLLYRTRRQTMLESSAMTGGTSRLGALHD